MTIPRLAFGESSFIKVAGIECITVNVEDLWINEIKYDNPLGIPGDITFDFVRNGQSHWIDGYGNYGINDFDSAFARVTYFSLVEFYNWWLVESWQMNPRVDVLQSLHADYSDDCTFRFYAQ